MAAARWGRREVGAAASFTRAAAEATRRCSALMRHESARVDAKCSNKFNTHLSVQKHNSHRFREVRVLLWGPSGGFGACTHYCKQIVVFILSAASTPVATGSWSDSQNRYPVVIMNTHEKRGGMARHGEGEAGGMAP